MALNWKDKQDGVDFITADDVNSLAHAIEDLEENGGGSGGIIDAYTKQEADAKFATKEEVGDIETALDGIIAIQENLIGGDAE